MTNVQIKNVPPETHAVLRRRAAEAHQSLQEYLRSQLIEQASQPTLDEVLDEVGNQQGGKLSLSSVVEMLREDRARH